jgi:hypothetical protein
MSEQGAVELQALELLRRIASLAPDTWMGREAVLLLYPYGKCGCGEAMDEHGCPLWDTKGGDAA